MTTGLGTFSCHLCEDSSRFDLPALTEHLASTHMDGFYTLRCPRCSSKFATFHAASHHLDQCDAPDLHEWMVSNRASDFEKHDLLNILLSEAIKRLGDGPRAQNEQPSTPACPRSESEAASVALVSPVPAAVESATEENVEDEERSTSVANVDIEQPEAEKQPHSEMVAESSVSINMRKRRHDVASGAEEKPTIERCTSSTPFTGFCGFPLEIQIPAMPQRYEKNVDLMSIPHIGAPAAAQRISSSATMGHPTTSSWYYSPPGQSSTSANAHNKDWPPSKLQGPMPIWNMCMFDEKTKEEDIRVEVEGSKGVHTMYFPEKLLSYCSPFFKQLLQSPDFQEKKKLTLGCALPSFLDCMHVIYSKPLPWTITCEGFFRIKNLHRIVRLLRTADGLQMKLVRIFVAKQLFANRCGLFNANPNLCECVGCIDRVALALYFGIDIPLDLSFSPQASITWLNCNQQYSCAPELKVVDAVRSYLTTFLSQAIQQ